MKAQLYTTYAFAGMAAIMLTLSGCVGKKGAVKETISPDATAGEKKEIALKLFKEGAELLYKDNQAALTKFDQARDVDPTLIPAHFNAGIALEALDQPQAALARYEACLEHNRQQESCLDNWIVIKADLGQFDEADAMVGQYLSEFPDAPFAMVAAAKLALIRKDYVRAERYALQAIEHDAENFEALLVMGWVFYERKQYPAAKWVLKNALEIAPSHGGLHLLLGYVDYDTDLLVDALDSYSYAVKEQPSDEAQEIYGLLLLKRGLVADALPVFKRLVETRPNDARNHLHLGNAYAANKMFDEAKASYLIAMEKNPDDFDVNFNLGLLYYDFKPKDLAEIDRLKTAKSYFETYLKKAGLSKERQAEVKEYLRILNDKIEYAAESSQPAEEEAPPEEDGKKENSDEEQEKTDSEPAKKDEAKTQPPSNESHVKDSEQEKDREEKTKQQEEHNKKKEKENSSPEGFDEEEGFFEDL